MIRNILLRLQERIYEWTKSGPQSLLFGILADLGRSEAELLVERDSLRNQIRILKGQVDKTHSSPKDGDGINL